MQEEARLNINAPKESSEEVDDDEDDEDDSDVEVYYVRD